MKLASFEAIVRALNAARVRYLIAGGVAVVAHGYERLTHALDLVVQLQRDNLLRAFEALSRLDYHPTVPVTAEDFADLNQRANWIDTKVMEVLNLASKAHPETTIDLFVIEPFDFDREYEAAMRANIASAEAAMRANIASAEEVRFVTIPTLIAMKQTAAATETPATSNTSTGASKSNSAMTGNELQDNWSAATWKGNRRTQLRDALKRTVRQRLERLDMLAETSRHFGVLRAEGRTRIPSVSDDGQISPRCPQRQD